MQHFLEAQVIDSHHLRLKKPIKIAPGSIVMIAIETQGKSVSDDQEWYLLSANGLADAYDESEPDYSLDRIKVHNPEYQP